MPLKDKQTKTLKTHNLFDALLNDALWQLFDERAQLAHFAHERERVRNKRFAFNCIHLLKK